MKRENKETRSRKRERENIKREIKESYGSRKNERGIGTI